jgi:hypothetical protein
MGRIVCLKLKEFIYTVLIKLIFPYRYDLRSIHEQNMRLDPEQRKKKRESRSERQVEALPIKSLLATYEPIIGQARDYQLELFEAAKKENIIAVLDTGMCSSDYELVFVIYHILGSGKTLIACLLIRHILDKELEDREAGKRSRVSVFLVSIPALQRLHLTLKYSVIMLRWYSNRRQFLSATLMQRSEYSVGPPRTCSKRASGTRH